MTRTTRRIGAALAALTAVAALAACGDDEKANAGTEKADGGASLKAFEASVDELIAAKTAPQTTKPPTAGPKAQPGKKIFVVPCAMVANGCAASATAAKAAAEEIGWDVTLIDPAGDPTKQNNAIETAIAQKADGIYLTAIDAKTVSKSLARAQEAGLKVVCFACSDPEGAFDSLVPTSPKDAYDEGYLTMASLYKATDGDLKAIMINGPEYGIGSDKNGRQEGAEAFIDECQKAGGSCEVTAKEDILTANFTTTVPGQLVSSVRQHPDATAIWSFADAVYAFIQPALAKANVDLPIAGIDPTAFNLDLVRSGKEYASVAVPFGWVGYAGVDDLNRMFAGEKPVDQGVTGRLLTKDSVPASGEYEGDLDVAPLYRTLWGLDG